LGVGVEDVRRIWIDTSQIALDLMTEPQISVRWSDESSLPHMSIGALVGHLLHSGILFLEECLDQPEPTDRPIRASTLFSLLPLDGDDDLNIDAGLVSTRPQPPRGPSPPLAPAR
jgi:hypothetical protein